MSRQQSLEDLLREVHLMMAECPKIKGDPDKIVVSKTVLLGEMEKISRFMYEMMDAYELNTQTEAEKKGKMQREYRQTVEEAKEKAEDVYSASILYTDEAITRLIKLINDSQRSVEVLYANFERELRQEVNDVRKNQRELQDLLFDLKDANIYTNLLQERRRKIEKEKEDARVRMAIASSGLSLKPAPEIKINKAYYEHNGLNEDGTPAISEEAKPADKPEIKVDLNSNYFKWKRQQEGTDGSEGKTEITGRKEEN